MLEGYANIAGLDEARRAFALDCVVRLMEPLPEGRVTRDLEFIAKKIVEFAEVFESYLGSKSNK